MKCVVKVFQFPEKKNLNFFFPSSDIVERFILIVFLTWLLAFNVLIGTHKHTFDLAEIWLPAMIIYVSEIVVDWLKHATCCSVNIISPG
jgi:hypothetical protein